MKPLYTLPQPAPLDSIAEARLVIGDLRPGGMRSLDRDRPTRRKLYVALCERWGDNNERVRQEVLEVQTLRSGELQTAMRRNDVYLSQAVFCAPNRRKESLYAVALLFIDIDWRQASWSEGGIRMRPSVAHGVARLLAHLDASALPRPSYILASGRGLHVKWLTEPLPAAAASRWRACMKQLCSLLAPLGADQNARDTSRILRTVGSGNTRAGRVVHEAWSNRDAAGGVRVYRFEELADVILPVSRKKCRKKTKARKGKTSQRQSDSRKSTSCPAHQPPDVPGRQARRPPSPRELWAGRLRELEQLFEVRGYGRRGLPDGLRVTGMLVMCVGLSYLVAPEQLLTALAEYRDRYVPHWDDEKLRQSVCSVLRDAKQGKRRRYRNATLVQLFSINETERRALPSIGKTKEQQKEAKRKAQERRRRMQGAQSADELLLERVELATRFFELYAGGVARGEIVRELGISVSTFYRLRSSVGALAGGKSVKSRTG